MGRLESCQNGSSLNGKLEFYLRFVTLAKDDNRKES